MRFEWQQPKDIAKDLLKGALDLHALLSCLASCWKLHSTIHLNQKHISVTEFEKLRRFADGFLKSGNEELKKVTRDSHVRQNLTKNVVGEESEKRIIMDDKSDASPFKAGLADENPKEEETDAYVSHSGGMAFLNCKPRTQICDDEDELDDDDASPP
ncbi:hypothetical protein ACFX11_026528 [Malus domestica]